MIAFSDGILEVLPPETLAEQEQFLLDKLGNVGADIEEVLPALGVEDTEGLPDDIAVFMVARGYHDEADAVSEERRG